MIEHLNASLEAQVQGTKVIDGEVFYALRKGLLYQIPMIRTRAPIGAIRWT
jgi:hypothetical protein